MGKRIDMLTARARAALPTGRLLAVLAILIGLGAGCMALLLKTLVHALEHLVKTAGLSLGGLPLLLSPALGVLLTILLVRLVVKDDISHGLSKVLQSIAVKGADMPRHSVWSYVAACSLTAGFGGSVGMEAPILATGGGIGSNLGRALGLDYRSKVVLVGCGAAAAVAAIFKAPIAGLIIALEMLAIDSTASAIMPILLASVSAALVSMGLSDRSIEFSFPVGQNFQFANLPWYVVLGVFCGLLSVLFSRLSWAVEDRARRWRPAVRFGVGAGAVGLLVFAFPPLFGEGYAPMHALLSGSRTAFETNPLFGFLPGGAAAAGWPAWLFLAFLALTLLLKMLATPLTTAAGGVGGIFAPSLFMGCLAGVILAQAANLSGLAAWLGAPAPETRMALVGMAGMLSGVMHAPLTAIFLIAEISGGYGLFIPLIICAAISYYTVRRFERYSLYTKHLATSGQLITREKDRSALGLLQLDRFVRNDAPCVDAATPLAEIVDLLSQSRSELLVVRAENVFKGFIFVDEIRQVMFVQETYRLVIAQDLCEAPGLALRPDMGMDRVLAAFAEAARLRGGSDGDASQYLPVIDADGGYRGFVFHPDVLAAYRQKILDISAVSED